VEFKNDTQEINHELIDYSSSSRQSGRCEIKGVLDLLVDESLEPLPVVREKLSLICNLGCLKIKKTSPRAFTLQRSNRLL